MPFFEGRKRKIEKKIEEALPADKKEEIGKIKKEKEEKAKQARLEEERAEKERIEKERKEKEEAIRGISGYLKEHKEKAATKYFEEKIAGTPEIVLKEYESEAKNIIKLEEKFSKGKVKKELIEMIKEIPTLREKELKVEEEKADTSYNNHRSLWREAEEGSEDKKDYQKWYKADKEKRDISRKEKEEEASKREEWAEMLKTGKLSPEEIKGVLGKKETEEKEIKEAKTEEEK